ncbi:MAG: putative ABC exporter domain-containing protein [Butyrivibrio sp.]|nr:putative ABC exporter domain-containing protein [Acetatifactor muris]MCM1559096.1 putative ABC exporter domain-containing protein [Butyrivibrio sp.]
MGAVGYLYRRTLANRVKKALHKPVTYVYIVFILFYLTVVPVSLRVMAEEYRLASPDGMVLVLTALAIWIVPANLAAYAKRKGLVYRNSDAHFLFPSPVSPKRVLIYAYIRTLFMQVLLNLFAVACGVIIFRVAVWRLAVYVLFSLVVENVAEGCIMLMLYGSERLGETQRKWIVRAAYGLIGVLVLIGVYYYMTRGLHASTLAAFLKSDAVKLVPVAGWYISVIHLLFGEVSAMSITGSVLYLCLLAAAVFGAVRMKCTGAFYEDAAKFAEDYEEVLENQRQGGAKMRIGRKQKFGRASVRYRGTGARALFYRQLLEYKKGKFFIFNFSTLISLAAGIGIAWLYVREGDFGGMEPYIIPMVSAYITFIFTTLNGKWAKELKSPYTYLIPDSAFAKLLNATGIQLIQNLINGLLITAPGAVVMGMSPQAAALCVIACAVFASNKLYALAVAEIAVGGTLGVVGKQLFQMFIQCFVIMAAVLGAVLGAMTGGVTLAYGIMDIFLLLLTAAFMVIAALNFYKMETA